MVQRVGDDEVAFTTDRRDDRGVCREAHANDDGSLLAHVLGRRLLDLLDQRVVTQLRGTAGGRNRVIHHGFCHERRAVRVEPSKPEVVVRSQVEASPRLRRGDELAEVSSLRLGLADRHVDPVLGRGVHRPVEDILNVAVQVANVEEILELALAQRREVVLLAVLVVGPPVLDASQGVERILTKTLGNVDGVLIVRRGVVPEHPVRQAALGPTARVRHVRVVVHLPALASRADLSDACAGVRAPVDTGARTGARVARLLRAVGPCASER
mmetsp:Transcript_11853/g.45902  ORF Transcript_11853/g.45902 Transcript_11853/m.45902 type:complete len:269 (+) Transcript_11853:3950-4756(+)